MSEAAAVLLVLEKLSGVSLQEWVTMPCSILNVQFLGNRVLPVQGIQKKNLLRTMLHGIVVMQNSVLLSYCSYSI